MFATHTAVLCPVSSLHSPLLQAIDTWFLAKALYFGNGTTTPAAFTLYIICCLQSKLFCNWWSSHQSNPFRYIFHIWIIFFSSVSFSCHGWGEPGSLCWGFGGWGSMHEGSFTRWLSLSVSTWPQMYTLSCFCFVFVKYLVNLTACSRVRIQTSWANLSDKCPQIS